MKGLLILCLFARLTTAQPVKATSCNQMFMESFDVLGQTNLTLDRNYLCPGVSSNCCSYQSQLEIYKKWIVSGEKHKIKSFYSEFPKVFDRIYAAFEQIESIAEKVIDATLLVAGSNCNRLASVIFQNRPSLLREKVVDAARTATNFLFKAREGLYCSICDGDNHRFYNNTDFTFTESFKFCAKTVENTLPYYIFKYDYFVKISRLIGQFLTTCSLRGVYRPTRFIRGDLKFYKHKAFSADARRCQQGLTKPGAIASCQNFCARFNPIKYDESLEGELDKLANYATYLERRVRIIKLEERRELEFEKEAEKHPDRRRLLEVNEEETHKVRKEHLDEETDELIMFNRQFQTALLRPIPYAFRSDLAIKYNVQFDEPIIRTGFERIYDLLEYRARFNDTGIDYNSYGQMMLVDRENAMKIFEIINPEKQLGFSFEDYLKSK